MANILIIGATSAIARATARKFAVKGDFLYLFGRDMERLKGMAEDLKVRGAKGVDLALLDVDQLDRHETLLDEAIKTMKRIDVVLIAHGTLPDQKACEKSVSKTFSSLKTNLMGTISLLTLIANRMASAKRGTIIVLSSVAGDRGRGSNYIYGTAKSALTTFLGGLRNRLHRDNVRVMTVKPGFVDTPMTADFKKGALWATPEDIAEGILKALDKKKDVVYLPFFWRYIMTIITLIPEKIFKRLSL